jgi:tight adherence protein C
VVRVTGLAPWAVLCGLALGLGFWLLVSLTPRLSKPNLPSRVAPYVIDVSVDARELLDRRTADPLPVFGALLDPVLGRVQRALGQILGGTEVTHHRLRQAGETKSIEEFRSQQIIWAAVAAGCAVLLSIIASTIQSMPVAADIAFVLVACVAGFLGRDYVLQRRASARVKRMSKELPTVLEFMTLSLSAGEGILDAIRRVSRISHGALARELGVVVSDVNSGVPLADSLARLSSQLGMPSLTRAIDQIVGALERGTPLAEVLRAQAQDARDDAKRELLELSGKKEVAMLVPLVFIILPVTIAIAVFPGLLVLQAGFG